MLPDGTYRLVGRVAEVEFPDRVHRRLPALTGQPRFARDRHPRDASGEYRLDEQYTRTPRFE